MLFLVLPLVLPFVLLMIFRKSLLLIVSLLIVFIGCFYNGIQLYYCGEATLSLCLAAQRQSAESLA